MEKYYITPDITGYPGVKVTKDTKLSFKNVGVKQEVKDLMLIIELEEHEDKYFSSSVTKIFLKEGDILIYDENKGYKLPGIQMQTANEIIEDFKSLI